jgi:PmbA protein
MPERSPEAAELVARAAQAIDLARAAGASAAAASASRSRAVELGLRDGVLEKVQESTSRGLSLELYVDGRYSSHSTTDLRPDRLQAFVAEAVALTRALQPDPLRVLPDPALYPKGAGPELDLVDPAVVHMRREDRVAALQEVGAGFAGAAGVISWTAGLNDSHGLSARVSSDGFEGVHESTSAWMGAEVTLQDPSGARPEDWHWGGGHHLSDRPAASSIATRALELAKQRLGAGKGPTRRTLMVVDPRAAGRQRGEQVGHPPRGCGRDPVLVHAVIDREAVGPQEVEVAGRLMAAAGGLDRGVQERPAVGREADPVGNAGERGQERA